MNTIWLPDLSAAAGPKYKVLTEALRGAVREGQLAVDEKLPPVRELAYQLGVTPGTVARAYSQLVDAGVLKAVVGRGTFVATIQGDTPALFDQPAEVDSQEHNAVGDGYAVNMVSPHLPNVGQARLIRRLLGEVAQNPASGMMHYPTRASSLTAREAVVHWLRDVPIGSITADDVILANGGQNAILLVLQTLLKGRKPTILVEELSYPGFRRAAELLRADVVPVAMDADGIIPEALEAAARQHEAQILCTSPEVHNPTLRFTPEARRHDIVDVARRLDLEILEDDCYRMNTAQAVSYRVLAPERAWYIGSISKMLTPALRLGYVVTPEGSAAKLRRSAEYSFFGLATPLTDLFTKLLPHPQMPEFTQQIMAETNRYIQATVNILGGYDLMWRPDVLFLWLTLPEGWRASAFCQAAEAQGVRIRSAEDYTERNATTRHAVRIAINAGVGLASYEAAISRLRELLDNQPEQFGV